MRCIKQRHGPTSGSSCCKTLKGLSSPFFAIQLNPCRGASVTARAKLAASALGFCSRIQGYVASLDCGSNFRFCTKILKCLKLIGSSFPGNSVASGAWILGFFSLRYKNLDTKTQSVPRSLLTESRSVPILGSGRRLDCGCRLTH